jgi:dolichol-phosphate mannosyltransferase
VKTLVIIPTYNESENLQELIPLLFQTPAKIQVLVVDDSSPDGTGRRVQEMMRDYPGLFLLERTEKQGIARAYVAGFQWVLERDHEAIICMDGDMSHHPAYIPQFLRELQDHEVIVGSRWVHGGDIRDWPFYRKAISLAASMYARLILGIPIHDLTGGFNGYRRRVLTDVGPENIRADGYGFQIEMKYRAFRKGYSLREIPIVFPDRQRGKSKFSRRIVWEALFLVLKLRLWPRMGTKRV